MEIVWCLVFVLKTCVAPISDDPWNIVMSHDNVRFSPNIYGAWYAREWMELDITSPDSWIWVHDRLVPLGHSGVGGMRLDRIDAGIMRMVAPTSSNDGSLIGLDEARNWITTMFRVGPKVWRQPIELAEDIMRFPFSITDAGRIGASPSSAFALAVGMFGFHPDEFTPGQSAIFFDALDDGQCHQNEKVRLELLEGAHMWSVSSEVHLGGHAKKGTVVFDSMSASIALSDEIYDAFLSNVTSLMSAPRYDSINRIRIDCPLINRLPDIVFTFPHTSGSISMTPWMYTVPTSNDDCVINVSHGSRLDGDFSIGSALLRYFTVVFDANARHIDICIERQYFDPRKVQPMFKESDMQSGALFAIVVSVLISLYTF